MVVSMKMSNLVQELRSPVPAPLFAVVPGIQGEETEKLTAFPLAHSGENCFLLLSQRHHDVPAELLALFGQENLFDFPVGGKLLQRDITVL